MAARDELSWCTAGKINDMVVGGSISAVEIADHFMQRISTLNATLHAFITLAPEQVRKQAEIVDALVRRGGTLGKLGGVPVSIKDLYATRGIRTTGGSMLFSEYIPTHDSVYAERLRRARALMVGKTNTPEFGLGARTTNRLVGETPNPWDPRRVSAGSSGGAAASVAVGMTPLAVGSDGGGSIRLPAAFCGVFGLQPSNGRVPRHGGFGNSLFLASAGPISRDVRDAAVLLRLLARPDPRDPTCARSGSPDYVKALDKGVSGLRMAWWSSAGEVPGVEPDVIDATAKAALVFEGLGAYVEELRTPLAGDSERASTDTLFNAEAYAFLGQAIYEDPGKRGLLSPVAIERFEGARRITASEYVRALRTRSEFIRRTELLFDRYSLILSPTSPMVAGPEIQAGCAAFTSPVNFGGFTAATVPCGFVRGLPIGLQIIGARGGEELVLRASRAFEVAQPWSAHRPSWPRPLVAAEQARQPVTVTTLANDD